MRLNVLIFFRIIFDKIIIYQINQLKLYLKIITYVGNFNGALGKLPAHELGSVVIKEVLLRADIKAEDVNEIILGQVI